MVAREDGTPRILKPGELCRLLNAAGQGKVLTVNRLYRMRQRADAKIDDGQRVDLLRFGAWLVKERQARSGDKYEKRKEKERKRQAEIAAEGRDIGELPDVVNPVRKDRCRADFQYFCEQYFPKTFCLGWSKDHLRVIAKIEAAVLRGGQFNVAMPRGSGKTSLCEAACIWAIVYGHRHFIAIVAASDPLANDVLDSIKTEFESNDTLAGDFPEVCVPIQKLEGINNRASGQLYRKQRTHISWTKGEIVLPTMPGSVSSGAIIKTAGITGAVRGLKHKRRDGTTDRPELVLIDDPQTAASARSAAQCRERERIISGDVLGLAGPDTRLAALMPMTVVRPGDLADTLLDDEKHPEWESERCPLVYTWPDRVDLWEKFEATLTTAEGNAEERQRKATEFYRDNREAMDAGAVVSWPDRYYKDTQLSALQYAYEWKIRDPEAFAAEAQQAPLTDDRFLTQLTADDVMQKTSGLKRGLIPHGTTHLTAAIDIQQLGLYYVVCAWQPNFSGSVVDYGTWPEQNKTYFRRTDLSPSMMQRTGTDNIEAAVYAALSNLVEYIAGRDWRRDGGNGIQMLNRLLIDANWSKSTPAVYQFCRESKFRNVLTPAHGVGVGPANRPISEHAITDREQIGLEWKIITDPAKRPVPYALIDTNYWKSFVSERWTTPTGGAGSLSVFGDKPAAHQLFADHQTAEYRTPTTGRGRTVEVWAEKPERIDNDFFDCTVSCAVGASMAGVSLTGTQIREERTAAAAQWSAFLAATKSSRR